MKTLIYMALFLFSALALAQNTMNGAPELSQPGTANQNEAVESDTGVDTGVIQEEEDLEDRQDMEEPTEGDIQGIEGVENQDSPEDMSTVPETTPTF